MALTDNGGLSAADVAAVMGSNGNNGFGGFGGDGAWWLLVLFLFALGGNGWGNANNGGGYGGGYGGYGGFYGLYPWLNNSNQINDGFRDQMINSNIQGIQNSVTSGFGDVQTALCGGFAGVNASITGAQNAIAQQMYGNQIADMERSFASQTAITQGMTGLQSQLAQCCCDNRLATCQTQNIVQNESNATRFADANNTRDIIENANRNNQAVLDKLCQLELDNKQTRINELERQLTMADLRASQIAQTAEIQRGQVAEVDALYNRLATCPVPCQPVYGSQPIFTCNGNNGNGGCGCNNGFVN